MTRRTKAILESIEQLNDREQQELVVTLLRKRAAAGAPAISDDELIQAAEVCFLALDRKEAADEKPGSRRGLAR